MHAVCRGIGDLILVYKRITSLAGHTSRVSELLEQVISPPGSSLVCLDITGVYMLHFRPCLGQAGHDVCNDT